MENKTGQDRCREISKEQEEKPHQAPEKTSYRDIVIEQQQKGQQVEEREQQRNDEHLNINLIRTT